MKKTILLIQVVILFLALTDAYSQSGWNSQVSGTGNDLIGVCFTDANNGTAVGTYGTIIRTTNGGTNWTLQSSGITNVLFGVSFTDANNGTAVGQVGRILRTTNGGTNWTIQSSGTTNNLFNVSFTDANNGTAVGSSGYPPPYDVTILRTTNGGANWISQTSGTTNALRDVSFTDANNGTAVGYVGTIIRTTNGGTNWTSQSSGTGKDLEGVSFTDANNGTAVGTYGTILRTTDGGTSWILQNSGTSDHLYGVCFTDANTGTAVGWAGIILRTTNGGTNWITQISGKAELLFEVSFIDANTGTTSGKNGTILRTTNGGTFPIPAAPLLISPINNAIGQAINLSLSWNPVEYASTYRVQLASDITFTNIILDDSALIFTVKAVTNLSPLTDYYWRVNAKNISGTGPFSSVWHFKTLGSPMQVNLLYPPDDTTNIPINVNFIWSKPGEQNNAIRTSKHNNKDNRVINKYWFELTTDTSGAPLILDSTLTDTTKSVGGLPNPITYYWHVRAKNETGWGVFSVWFKFTTVSPPPLAPVLVSPQNGALLVETNPLLDWYSSATALSYRVQISTDSLFTSTLYDSSNIAITEFQIPNNGLNINTTYYWRVNATNAGGTSPFSSVWHFTTGATNISLNSEIPKEFKLYNSYPNPFNPSTKIKFDIPKSSYVKLIVYDVLGREIKTLVNEKLNAGRYEVEFEATSYPSGVYFYKMVTDNYVSIKKMVLLK